MARRFTRTRGRAGARRESVWIGAGNGTVSLAAASTASLTHTLNAAALALRPFTIVRTRGYWHVRGDQTIASENYGASLGYSVVSDQALAIGITAVPLPETDKSSDKFFLFESLMGRLQFVSGIGIQDPAGLSSTFDSKAMRRVEEGEDVAFVAETGLTVTSGFVNSGWRMLVKLH